MVNNQLIEEENPPISTGSKARRRRTNTKDPLQSLGNRVSESWRKVTSGELCAYHVQRIHWLRGAQLPLGPLQEKHPSPHSDSSFPPTSAIAANTIAVLWLRLSCHFHVGPQEVRTVYSPTKRFAVSLRIAIPLPS